LFGIIARFTFLYINKLLYNIPKFSNSSTLLTVSITSLSYIFIIGVNSFFLKEVYNNQIYFGFFLIVVGISVIFNAR
jgi:drug/metabolite transporter (DMT)-like permease